MRMLDVPRGVLPPKFQIRYSRRPYLAIGDQAKVRMLHLISSSVQLKVGEVKKRNTVREPNMTNIVRGGVPHNETR